MEKVVPRIPVTCEFDGKTYRGTYWVAGHILTVATGMGGKSKQVAYLWFDAIANELYEQFAAQ